MSVSRHPIALRLEEVVGRGGALLAVVMCLPLVDGIFPALVVGGALDSWPGVLQVGLLIFGGSATVAVVIADVEGSPRERAQTVLLVAVPLVALAAVEAAFAPTLAGLLDLAVFQRFAALVVLAVAASTASARVANWIPRPAVVVVLGLVASVDPAGATLAATPDLGLALRGVAAALVGAGFALGLALASGHLSAIVDLDLFRFGSAVALGLLGVGLLPGARELGLLVSDWAPLVVLGLSALFAFDPAREVDWRDAVPDVGGSDGPRPAADGGDAAGENPAVVDGGDDPAAGEDGDAGGYPGEERGADRPPWL